MAGDGGFGRTNAMVIGIGSALLLIGTAIF
jgi:hypothetical protein